MPLWFCHHAPSHLPVPSGTLTALSVLVETVTEYLIFL